MGQSSTGITGFTLRRSSTTTIASEPAPREPVSQSATPETGGFERVSGSRDTAIGTQNALAQPSRGGFQLATRSAGTMEQAAQGPYRIAAAVGRDKVNDPRDVAWVTHRLQAHVDREGRPFLQPGGDVFDALRRFQRERTRARDGVVDPKGATEFALARSPAHRLRGSVGTRGRNRPQDVAKVQSTMVLEGLLVPGSFTYGSIADPADENNPTIRAIRTYQERVGTVDGRIDVRGTTHQNIRAKPRVEPRGLPISGSVGGRRASSSEDVALVQERLVAHEVLEAGSFATGTLDDTTRAAIRQFQTRFMRRPDGVVSRGKGTSRYLFLTPEALSRALGTDATTTPAPTPQPQQPSPEPATDRVYKARYGDTPLTIISKNYRRGDGRRLNLAEQQRILAVVAEHNQATLPHFEDGRVGANQDVKLLSPEDIAATTGLEVVRSTPPPSAPTPDSRPPINRRDLGTVRAVTGDMTVTTPPPASIRKHLDDAAAATGIPRRWMYNMANVESAFNPRSVNGRYRGLYQMTQADVTRYLRRSPVPGLRSESATDARAAAFAFARMTAERIRRYSRRWGRPVEEFEIYMMHQQGPSGYHHHASNPSRAAWANFRRATGNTWSGRRARRAIWGNMSRRMRRQFPGGVDTVTSGDFIRVWREGYDRKRRGLSV